MQDPAFSGGVFSLKIRLGVHNFAVTDRHLRCQHLMTGPLFSRDIPEGVIAFLQFPDGNIRAGARLKSCKLLPVQPPGRNQRRTVQHIFQAHPKHQIFAQNPGQRDQRMPVIAVNGVVTADYIRQKTCPDGRLRNLKQEISSFTFPSAVRMFSSRPAYM